MIKLARLQWWEGGEKTKKPQSHSAAWLEGMRSVSSTDSSDCTADNWLQKEDDEEEDEEDEESLVQLPLTTHRV